MYVLKPYKEWWQNSGAELHLLYIWVKYEIWEPVYALSQLVFNCYMVKFNLKF